MYDVDSHGGEIYYPRVDNNILSDGGGCKLPIITISPNGHTSNDGDTQYVTKDRFRDFTICIGDKTNVIYDNTSSICVSINDEIFSFNFNYNRGETLKLLEEYENTRYKALSIILLNGGIYMFKTYDDYMKVVNNIKYVKNIYYSDIHKGNMPNVYRVINTDHLMDISNNVLSTIKYVGSTFELLIIADVLPVNFIINKSLLYILFNLTIYISCYYLSKKRKKIRIWI